MSRRTRWILLALIVVLVGGAVALVRRRATEARRRSRSTVDDTWKPLRAPDQLRAALPDARRRAQRVRRRRRRATATCRRTCTPPSTAWTTALRDGDAGVQATAANTVEAQGTRLLANVLGSERLKRRPGGDRRARPVRATPSPSDDLVTAYNRAVRAYEDERTGTPRSSRSPASSASTPAPSSCSAPATPDREVASLDRDIRGQLTQPRTADDR